MLSIAGRLDEDEVRQVFRTLLSPSFDFGLIGMGPITNYAVNCNDRGPRISNDLGFSHYRDFEVPQLIGPGVQWPAHYEIACAQLGLPAGDYAPPPPPFESDVPALVVGATLDTATPAILGQRVAEALANATVVEIPMAGHTSGLLTPCGQALVHAFVLSPGVAPNLACVEAARPVFVMPDESLPGQE